MQAAEKMKAVFNENGATVLITDGTEDVIQAIQDCNMFVVFGTGNYGEKRDHGWHSREHVRLAIKLRKPMVLINMLRPHEYFEDAYAIAIFEDPKRRKEKLEPIDRSDLRAPDPAFDDFISRCLHYYNTDGTQCPNFKSSAGCARIGCPYSHMDSRGVDNRVNCAVCTRQFHPDFKEDGSLHKCCMAVTCRKPCEQCKQIHADVNIDVKTKTGSLHECWIRVSSKGGNAGGGGARK